MQTRPGQATDKAISVLIVDDDPSSLDVLRMRCKHWGYDVVTARAGPPALDILRQTNGPKLAVLDWMMPGMSGVDVCRVLRKKEDADYIYVVMLTCRGQREDIIAGLNAGADDYLIKPFNPEELELRLRTGRRIVELQKRLQLQADHDSLTGVWNRGRIMRFLGEELNRAWADEDAVAVAMVDIDHFKSINDTHGHAAGDAVLKGLCRRLPPELRPYDAFGRMGGEEFLAVLPSCDYEGAMAAVERLRKLVASQPFRIAGGQLNVTASFGVAVTEPGAPVLAEGLVQAADEQLYQAKAGGRNCVFGIAGVAAAAA